MLWLCFNSLFFRRSQRDDSAVTAASVPVIVPLGDKDAIMNSIADSYIAHNELSKQRKYHKNRKLYKKIRKYTSFLLLFYMDFSFIVYVNFTLVPKNLFVVPKNY